MLAFVLVILLLALLGGLGFAVHALWLVAVIVLVAWLISIVTSRL